MTKRWANCQLPAKGPEPGCPPPRVATRHPGLHLMETFTLFMIAMAMEGMTAMPGLDQVECHRRARTPAARFDSTDSIGFPGLCRWPLRKRPPRVKKGALASKSAKRQRKTPAARTTGVASLVHAEPESDT